MGNENGAYTYRIQVTNRERVQIQKFDNQNRDQGQPAGRLNLEHLARVQALSQKATDGTITAVEVPALGEDLFDILFDDGLRPDFVSFYNTAVHTNRAALRVELDIDEAQLPDLAALPWEFMRVPTRANLGVLWLGSAPDVVLSRRRAQWNPATPIQLASGEKLRIAIVVSAPEGASLGPVEYTRLLEALNRLVTQNAGRMELLDVVTQATQESIDNILKQEPHIFHFIGHAQMNAEHRGRIALTDEVMGDALWVSADSFSDLFNRHRPGVVLLHACEGGKLSAGEAFAGIASRIVQQNIPVVVAMQHEVSNATAVRFAVRFYQQLAEYAPVDLAVQEGRRAVAFAVDYQQRDFATPVIFMRVTDGRLFLPAEPAPGPTPPRGSGTSTTTAAIQTFGSLRFDVAAPATVANNTPFEVAVSLRQPGSPRPTADTLANLPFPDDIPDSVPRETITVTCFAPGTRPEGPEALSVPVVKGRDSETFFFRLAVTSTRPNERLRLTVRAARKDRDLGECVLFVDVQQQPTGSAPLAFESVALPTDHAKQMFLRRMLAEFDIEGICDVAVALKMHCDDLAGTTRSAKAGALVERCRQMGQIDQLYAAAQERWPHVDWTLLPDMA